ncbi:cytochrome c biogenesis protein CcdA [Natronococcus sp. A-GB1]|uniref:cytochrome c biogenesis protein CcdA n=1 Tax=Natronococcus sp. A-GB1 TaxID=3037648 RepID=UPI00241CE4A6|nr:cytochrome c biogenesis protein CcdA [Natronococcus sp. A-GB1]MDG5760892.1 cytochrome c biogenesis protein CcdA [Natronococcus sp. A-GB1]
MIDAALLSTLAFALTAGVFTFFSPCAYPLLPGYVGFYVSQTDAEESSLTRAVGRGLVAGAGVLATFGVLLGVAFWIGHSVLADITIFEALVGVALVGFGVLVLFDRAPSLSVALPKRRSGTLGFGLFGAGYALAAAGCVAPVFLGVVASAAALPAASGALVIGTYVGIVVLLMVSLTVATGMGLAAGAGRLSAYGDTLRRVAGAVMILAGIGQLYVAFFLDVI